MGGYDDDRDDEELGDELFDDEDSDDQAILGLIGRFGASLVRVPWFTQLGARLDDRIKSEARDYLDALGFPDVDIAQVGSFREAEDAALSPGFDDLAWEAEEQL